MTNNRSELAKKYFLKPPDKPGYGAAIFWMVIGVILVFVGMASYRQSSTLICAGGSGLFLGFVGLIMFMTKKMAYDEAYNKTVPKATDAQMDTWMAQDRAFLIRESFNRLDLLNDNVINAKNPLVIVGPVSPTRVAEGEDGIYRFSRYSYVIIYLSNYHLAAYNCVWDFINATVSEESTQEYHYQDVVSVSTLTSNSSFTVTTIDGKDHPIAKQQEFSLSVASGEKIRVVVAFPQVEGILKQGKFMPSGADEAISTLRTQLREKKGGLIQQ